MTLIFVVAIAAHLLGDFLLQTGAIAMGKRRFGWLLLHSAVHGALVYLLLQQWSGWQLPLAIAGVHGVIDAIKVRSRRSATTFAADQAAHLLSVWLLVMLAVHQGWTLPFTGQGWAWIVGLAGLCATINGVGFFVGEVADRMFAENPTLQQMRQDGLKDGGKRIGQLERALIFVLIIAGEPTGIGFLIGAKSILRLEEAKKQHVAEYVLIGTLWSFGLAMVLAWLTRQALTMGPAP